MNKDSGFSLVELSIVLVILGLLTGAILGGQSLIRASELRAITTEYDQWQTALNTFKTKYFSVPGDMKNATRFWEDAGVCPAVVAETHHAPLSGTCDGTGNGIVYTNSLDHYERFLFWQHMQLAGLIPGTYTGTKGAGASFQDYMQPGINIAKTKISSAMWYVALSSLNNTHLFSADYSNALVLERAAAEFGNLLPPEEAWSIDTKIDDGKPATGIVITNRSNGNCTDGASSTDYSASYRLSEKGNVCSMYFLQNR